MLVLELLRLGLRDFERLKIVGELNFLVEDFLLWVIATEELRLCRSNKSDIALLLGPTHQ
jgi:hypothetical protein